jgi:hypothetical protein
MMHLRRSMVKMWPYQSPSGDAVGRQLIGDLGQEL